MEEIIELQSQLCCKKLAIELEKYRSAYPNFVKKVMGILPASISKKPSLAEQIQKADAKVSAGNLQNQAEKEVEVSH